MCVNFFIEIEYKEVISKGLLLSYWENDILSM